jgi:TolB-like protein
MVRKWILVALCLATPLFGAEKMRIAIMDLAPKPGVDATLAATVSELLRSEFVKTTRFDVIERSNMDAVMKEQGLQATGCTDASCAVKMGNMLNVQKIVVGSLSRLGQSIIINVSFVDVELSKIVMAEKETVTTVEGLEAASARLVDRMASKVGIAGKVVKVEANGTAYVNIGSTDGVPVGAKLAVYRLGDAIVDPETGDVLGRSQTDVGTIRVDGFMGAALCKVSPVTVVVPLAVGDRVTVGGEGAAAAAPVTTTRKERREEERREEETAARAAKAARTAEASAARAAEASTAPSPSSGGGKGLRTVRRVLLIGGGVLAAGGAVSMTMGFASHAEVDSLYQEYQDWRNWVELTDENVRVNHASELHSQIQDAISRGNTQKIIGGSLLGVGVTALTLGFILPKRSRVAEAAPRIEPGFDGRKLILSYRF